MKFPGPAFCTLFPSFTSVVRLFLIGIFFTCGSLSCLLAQEPLTLSASIEQVLKNNSDIQISHDVYQSSINDNTPGNAGMLPRIDLTAGYERSSANTEQEYSDNNRVKSSGAVTKTTQAGAHFYWTLFDGLKMFAAKSRLQATQDASGYQLKMQIENSVESAISNYFLVITLKQKAQVLDLTIASYDERVRISEMRYKGGSGSKLEFLQSQVDRNAKKSERLQINSQLTDALMELNRLMGVNVLNEYQLTDSITLTYFPSMDDLKKSVPGNNFEIRTVMMQEFAAQEAVKEARGDRLPFLNLTVDYNYLKTENEVGFLLFNANRGLYSGLHLYWNVFNGHQVSREVRNARLAVHSAALLLADTRARIEQELYVAFKQYEADREILDLETANSKVATENVTIAMEAFRLGSISGLALREAQDSYQEALSRLVDARYQAKLSETALMKLNGALVKNDS